MDSVIRLLISAILVMVFICTVGIAILVYTDIQVSAGEHITSEGTVTDKSVSSRMTTVSTLIPVGNHIMPVVNPIPVEEYCLTVNIAGNTYSLTVPCDTYTSIEVGDSLMFDLACKDDKVVAVSIATAESLTKLITE